MPGRPAVAGCHAHSSGGSFSLGGSTQRVVWASAAAMRLIAESASSQIDLAAGQELGGSVRDQLLVGGMTGKADPGSVFRTKIGNQDAPALQLYPGVDPGHGPGTFSGAKRTGLAERHRSIKRRLPAYHVVTVELQ